MYCRVKAPPSLARPCRSAKTQKASDALAPGALARLRGDRAAVGGRAHVPRQPAQVRPHPDQHGHRRRGGRSLLRDDGGAHGAACVRGPGPRPALALLVRQPGSYFAKRRREQADALCDGRLFGMCASPCGIRRPLRPRRPPQLSPATPRPALMPRQTPCATSDGTAPTASAIRARTASTAASAPRRRTTGRRSRRRATRPSG
eukprot:4689288-Prymnesium_polylepis.1